MWISSLRTTAYETYNYNAMSVALGGIRYGAGKKIHFDLR